MTPWERLAGIAAAQHGLISRSQARACGLGDSTLDRHVRTRGLRRVQPGVFALAGAAGGAAPRAKAVELAVGPPVLVTSWSALHLYGLVRAAPSSVHVLLPHGRRPPHLPRVVAHRTSVWDDDRAAKAAGVAVSSPARSIVVVAAEAAVPVVRGLVIDARQRRLLRLDDLQACVARLGRAKGTAVLRRVLGELDVERPDSVFEQMVRRRLREDGLAAPAPAPWPVRLRDGRMLHVDIAWPAVRVGLECDGFGSHAERSALATDALRHNGLADVGWQVRRVTWTTYQRQWAELMAQLRRLVMTAGSRAG